MVQPALLQVTSCPQTEGSERISLCVYLLASLKRMLKITLKMHIDVFPGITGITKDLFGGGLSLINMESTPSLIFAYVQMV